MSAILLRLEVGNIAVIQEQAQNITRNPLVIPVPAIVTIDWGFKNSPTDAPQAYGFYRSWCRMPGEVTAVSDDLAEEVAALVVERVQRAMERLQQAGK